MFACLSLAVGPADPKNRAPVVVVLKQHR